MQRSKRNPTNQLSRSGSGAAAAAPMTSYHTREIDHRCVYRTATCDHFMQSMLLKKKKKAPQTETLPTFPNTNNQPITALAYSQPFVHVDFINHLLFSGVQNKQLEKGHSLLSQKPKW